MSSGDAAPFSDQQKQSSLSEKVIRPLDPSDTWWARTKNQSNFAFDRLSKEDAARFIQLTEIRQWPKMLKKCQERRSYLMRYSPVIRFMNEKIGLLGGNINADNFPCNYCVDQKSGGFNPNYGMELCANKIASQSQQEDTMAHELMHVYDHLRFEVKWDDLRHSACSEVRASALSGECRFLNEFWSNGQYKLNRGYQDCVRRRAILSTRFRAACKDDDQAAKVVNEVFDSCMNDTRPFDEVYR